MSCALTSSSRAHVLAYASWLSGAENEWKTPGVIERMGEGGPLQRGGLALRRETKRNRREHLLRYLVTVREMAMCEEVYSHATYLVSLRKQNFSDCCTRHLANLLLMWDPALARYKEKRFSKFVVCHFISQQCHLGFFFSSQELGRTGFPVPTKIVTGLPST
jgi:hypothetical protein